MECPRQSTTMGCRLRVSAVSGSAVRLSMLVLYVEEEAGSARTCPPPGGTGDDIVVLQEERPQLTGGTVWEASGLLASALGDFGVEWQGARVLELGSGTGWLALKMAQRGASVTATDRRGMLDLLMRNVLRNQKRFPCTAEADLARGKVSELDVECVELDWEEGTVLPGKWDVIIGCEVMYLSQFYPSLVETIRRHTNEGTRIFISWQARTEDGKHKQGDFLEQARAAGLKEQLKCVQRTGANIPVYVYEFGLHDPNSRLHTGTATLAPPCYPPNSTATNIYNSQVTNVAKGK